MSLACLLLLVGGRARSQDTPCEDWETVLALGEESTTGFTPQQVIDTVSGTWQLTGTDASGDSHIGELVLTYEDGGAAEVYEECLFGVRVDVTASLWTEDGWLEEQGVAELRAMDDPGDYVGLTLSLGSELSGVASAEQADGAWDEDGYLLWLHLEGDAASGALTWAGGRSARGCTPEEVMGETLWTVSGSR